MLIFKVHVFITLFSMDEMCPVLFIKFLYPSLFPVYHINVEYSTTYAMDEISHCGVIKILYIFIHVQVFSTL